MLLLNYICIGVTSLGLLHAAHGDTLHLFGRKLELLLQVNISLSIDRHEMDVRVVDLKSEDEDSDLATLRHRLDLTGDLLSKDHHAPEQVILDIEDVVDLLARQTSV